MSATSGYEGPARVCLRLLDALARERWDAANRKRGRRAVGDRWEVQTPQVKGRWYRAAAFAAGLPWADVQRILDPIVGELSPSAWKKLRRPEITD